MMKFSGFGRRGSFSLKPAQCAAFVCSIAAAGCSADVARFDSSSFNLNDPPEETASVQRPAETVRGASDYESPVAHATPRGPYGVGAKPSSSVDVAALPEPVTAPMAPAAPRAVAAKPAYQPARPYAAAAPPMSEPLAKGQQIDVQQGDTLYGLSKRYHVSINELMQVNELKSPDLKLGQKIYLPAGRAPGQLQPRAMETAAAPAQAQFGAAAPVSAPAAAMSPPSAEQLAKYNGSYTVKPGDSLYGIARANRVSFAELQQVNGIVDPRKVRPGAVLRVPAGSSAPIAAAAPASVSIAEPTPAAAPPGSAQPTILNKNKQVAALTDKATDAQPVARTEQVATAAQAAASTTQAANSGKLRWPASGKVIAGFGGRPDGTHNDGINLSVPLGTEVHAAESGVVAYSGSELKGYGNLVLIRHDNGWVTAYAHNDELLVKHGDKISRGQVIAKAGKTGTVDQPQVHFELRQGSKPVDPTPFLEKL